MPLTRQILIHDSHLQQKALHLPFAPSSYPYQVQSATSNLLNLPPIREKEREIGKQAAAYCQLHKLYEIYLPVIDNIGEN